MHSGGMTECWTISQVANHLGTTEDAARGQLSRWGVAGVHHYPAAAIRAHHKNRTRLSRSARIAAERDPKRAPELIEPIVLGYDEDPQRQRLEGAGNVVDMVATITAAWLANPAGHQGGLRGFVERWLQREYKGWCDAQGCRT